MNPLDPRANPATAIEDRPDLLEEMVADEKAAPPEYRATNFWDVYERSLLHQLRTQGLCGFRGRRDSIMHNFLATSVAPEEAPVRAGPTFLPDRIRAHLGRWRYGAVDGRAYREQLFMDNWRLAHEAAKACGARPLSAISTSLAGGPGETFTVEGRVYTFSTLYYYRQYVWVAGRFDFDAARIVVELGAGAGYFIEILKKLHPHLTILLFDLSPQLYVSSSYLACALGGEVMDYRQAKHIESLREVPEGSICPMGAYRFPILASGNIDLFWNSASFQEMEPDVVANYLGFVRRSARAIYLRQMALGQLQASKPGEIGVLKKTRFADYVEALKSYRLVDIAPAWLNSFRHEDFHSIHDLGYLDALWIREG